jgi:hypothetical protein
MKYVVHNHKTLNKSYSNNRRDAIREARRFADNNPYTMGSFYVSTYKEGLGPVNVLAIVNRGKRTILA